MPCPQSLWPVLVASASRASVSAASAGLPGPAGRLDQLRQRPHGDIQLRRLRGGLLRLGPRLLVAAEAVVQDGRYPLRPLDPHTLARSPGVRADGLDQRPGLGFCPSQTGQEDGCVTGEAAPCRGRDRLRLRDQRSSRRKITAQDLIYRHPLHPDRQIDQQACLADGLQEPGNYRMPVLLLPHRDRGDRGQPAISQALIEGDLVLGNDARCPPQQRCRPGVSHGDQGGQRIQQQIGRPGRACGRRG